MSNTSRNSRIWWAFAGFLAIAAFFLLEEHRAHMLGVLPYLFLLACPFMHVFGHGGHRHNHGDAASPDSHHVHSAEDHQTISPRDRGS